MSEDKNQEDSSAPLLEVSGLSAEKRILFGDDEIALRDVSFTIKPGEIVAFCGESGSGKSTLTRAILSSPDPSEKIISGTVLLNGQDLLKLRRREMRKIRCSRIAYIGRQITHQLNPDITIRQHLRETLNLAERQDGPGEEKEWGPYFYEVGIVEPELVLSQRSRELSPLMIQRVMLLTALFSGAELLICDEPTAELDDVAEMYFYEVLCQLRDERKPGILLTCCHLQGLGRIANWIHVMCEGGILESESGRTLLHHPKFEYTAQLAKCSPDINHARKRLPVIDREAARKAEEAVHERCSALKAAPGEEKPVTDEQETG